MRKTICKVDCYCVVPVVRDVEGADINGLLGWLFDLPYSNHLVRLAISIDDIL